MNLLMISGDRALAAGKQGAFWNTLEELRKHFDRIDVVCPRVSVRRYDMVLFGNVHIHPSPWPLIFQPLWILFKGLPLIRHHTYQQSNRGPTSIGSLVVMTVHDYPPFYNGLGAFFLKIATGVPYVSELFHIPGYPRAASWKERWWRWWAVFFVRFTTVPSTAVRVMNKGVPDFLVRHGVPREKIRLIPAIYIDLETFKPTDIPKQYDLIFVGRLAKNKGLNLFLEVVRLTGLTALIVGDGPLLRSAKLKTKNWKLKTDFVGFAKDTTEVARHINESRLLLMTSYNEGGPRVVGEALACGVPVVATPVGIVPDILPPECIEEWDARALADKVRNILSDGELYRRLQEAGIQAAQRFERSGAIQKYADAIKNIAPHA